MATSLRDRVVAVVRSYGMMASSEALGVSHESVRRVLQGKAVRRGTLALIENNIAETERLARQREKNT